MQSTKKYTECFLFESTVARMHWERFLWNRILVERFTTTITLRVFFILAVFSLFEVHDKNTSVVLSFQKHKECYSQYGTLSFRNRRLIFLKWNILQTLGLHSDCSVKGDLSTALMFRDNYLFGCFDANAALPTKLVRSNMETYSLPTAIRSCTVQL